MSDMDYGNNVEITVSDTPRTDANYWRETSGPNGECVTADFARTLERELATLQRRLENVRDMASVRESQRDNWKRRAETAERRLAEAERAGMERAAKVCDGFIPDEVDWGGDEEYDEGVRSGVSRCARAIRALMKEADRG